MNSSFFNYGITYCDGQENGFGWISMGSNTEELHHRTRDFCIRRLKKEVLDELPDKVRTINTVQPSKTNLKRYNDLHRAWLEDYEMYAREGSIPKGFVLNMLTALRYEVDSSRPIQQLTTSRSTTTLLVSLSLSLHIIEMYSRASLFN